MKVAHRISATSQRGLAQDDATAATWIFAAPDTLVLRAIPGDQPARLAPGARELLAWLHDSGVRIVAACTSADARAALQLRTFALEGMFDLILDFEKEGAGAPCDRILRALSFMGARQERVILLACSSVDVHAGLQLGLQVLALRNGSGPPTEFNPSITSYRDPAELLCLLRYKAVTTLP